MKRIGHSQHQRYWTIGLMAALLLMTVPFAAGAQTSKTQIITIGAESTFKQKLSQPTQFLQSIGITLKEIQSELRVRPHVVVIGGAFVRNLGLTSFTNTQDVQKAKFSIHVVGAGGTRVLGLVAFTKTQNSQQSKVSIQLIGAGSVRDIGLVSPSSQ